MHGTHSLGSPPTAAGDAVNAQLQARLGPLVERVWWWRLPRALTAFTCNALFLELVARLERARLSPPTSAKRATAKPLRWCGASPLERKRAAWRERRRVSVLGVRLH